MGCDIHLKTYVHSLVENRMVPLQSCIEDGSYTPLIVDGRDYSLFGLFGNWARSDYSPLWCLKDGAPDFTAGTSFRRYLDSGDFHTVKWCWASELVADLGRYRAALTDPKLYLETFDEDDEVAQMAVRRESGTDDEMRLFLEFHQCLVASIDGVVRAAESVMSMVADELCDILDPGRIAFVTFMDS